MTERLIFCSSATIERDLLQKAGLFEIEDAILVPQSQCRSCPINCPHTPHYQAPAENTPLPARYQKLSW